MNIESGKPPFDGLYVAYIAYQARPSEIFPMVLVYGKDGWWFNVAGEKCSLKVEGWIGPLPSWPGQFKRDVVRLRDHGFQTVLSQEYDL